MRRLGAGGSSLPSRLPGVTDAHADAAMEEDLGDELEGVPVLDGDGEESDWHPVRGGGLPVVADGQVPTGPPGSVALDVAAPHPLQTVAVAAGGFVAGVAVVGLVQRRRRRRALAARRPRPRRGATTGPVGELVQIVGSRSLLVDVHLLGGRD